MQKIDFVNSQQPAVNDTNLNQMQDNIEAAINAQVSGDTLPIGSVLPYPSSTVPDNWLLCDGRAVSRTTYSQLFNIIGTTFGVGDGSTTFNLPNMKGKIPVGYDSSQTDFNSIGKTGGEKTHILTVDELAPHNHGVKVKMNASGFGDGYLTSASGYDYTTSNSPVNSTGGGQAHNNLQPYIVQNYIIKAFQTAGTVASVVNTYNTSTTNIYSANLINGTTLYENAEGIETGSFVINDDFINYKRIKIFEKNGCCLAEYDTTGMITQNQIDLRWFDQGSQNTYIKLARLTINNRTITIDYNKRTYYSNSTNTWTQDSLGLAINKVVGYKY